MLIPSTQKKKKIGKYYEIFCNFLRFVCIDSLYILERSQVICAVHEYDIDYRFFYCSNASMLHECISKYTKCVISFENCIILCLITYMAIF